MTKLGTRSGVDRFAFVAYFAVGPIQAALG